MKSDIKVIPKMDNKASDASPFPISTMITREAYQILIVEDQADIQELLSYNLEKEGYQVQMVGDGIKALEAVNAYTPHLILMDIMLPHLDGVETARKLREMPRLDETLLVFLTARSEEYAQVSAFEIGADDYITKPIKPRALLSRIQALLHRKTRQPAHLLKEEKCSVGELIIDKQNFVVYHKNTKLSLPKKEFELLYFLAGHTGRVYSRNDLLYHIWGKDIYVTERTVDVHIRKIREKIGDSYIKTIKGVGYILEYNP